jgi:hypothetical protein
VWLGNNRGNKYAQKHLARHPDSDAFWDFCIDDFARYDFPALVEHILAFTGYSRLAVVAFSQGAAQGLAALALQPHLNDRLSVFVALSPALAIRGLAKSPVSALVQADLSFLYLLFGRQRVLASAVEVQRVLSGSAWAALLDGCLMYLFGWRAGQIDPLLKVSAYHHLYSFTSVKSVVHWFQIIAQQRFAMMADVFTVRSLWSLFVPVLSNRAASEHRLMPRYDLKKVTVPLALFVGEADTLIDIRQLLAMLPPLSGAVPMPVGGEGGGGGGGEDDAGVASQSPPLSAAHAPHHHGGGGGGGLPSSSASAAGDLLTSSQLADVVADVMASPDFQQRLAARRTTVDGAAVAEVVRRHAQHVSGLGRSPTATGRRMDELGISSSAGWGDGRRTDVGARGDRQQQAARWYAADDDDGNDAANRSPPLSLSSSPSPRWRRPHNQRTSRRSVSVSDIALYTSDEVEGPERATRRGRELPIESGVNGGGWGAPSSRSPVRVPASARSAPPVHRREGTSPVLWGSINGGGGGSSGGGAASAAASPSPSTGSGAWRAESRALRRRGSAAGSRSSSASLHERHASLPQWIATRLHDLVGGYGEEGSSAAETGEGDSGGGGGGQRRIRLLQPSSERDMRRQERRERLLQPRAGYIVSREAKAQLHAAAASAAAARPRGSAAVVSPAPPAQPAAAAPSTLQQLPSLTAAAAARAPPPAYEFVRQPPYLFVEHAYEHLDFLWAATVRDRGFPAALRVLRKYAHRQFPAQPPRQPPSTGLASNVGVLAATGAPTAPLPPPVAPTAALVLPPPPYHSASVTTRARQAPLPPPPLVPQRGWGGGDVVPAVTHYFDGGGIGTGLSAPRYAPQQPPLASRNPASSGDAAVTAAAAAAGGEGDDNGGAGADDAGDFGDADARSVVFHSPVGDALLTPQVAPPDSTPQFTAHDALLAPPALVGRRTGRPDGRAGAPGPATPSQSSPQVPVIVTDAVRTPQLVRRTSRISDAELTAVLEGARRSSRGSRSGSSASRASPGSQSSRIPTPAESTGAAAGGGGGGQPLQRAKPGGGGTNGADNAPPQPSDDERVGALPLALAASVAGAAAAATGGNANSGDGDAGGMLQHHLASSPSNAMSAADATASLQSSLGATSIFHELNSALWSLSQSLRGAQSAGGLATRADTTAAVSGSSTAAQSPVAGAGRGRSASLLSVTGNALHAAGEHLSSAAASPKAAAAVAAAGMLRALAPHTGAVLSLQSPGGGVENDDGGMPSHTFGMLPLPPPLALPLSEPRLSSPVEHTHGGSGGAPPVSTTTTPTGSRLRRRSLTSPGGVSSASFAGLSPPVPAELLYPRRRSVSALSQAAPASGSSAVSYTTACSSGGGAAAVDAAHDRSLASVLLAAASALPIGGSSSSSADSTTDAVPTPLQAGGSPPRSVAGDTINTVYHAVSSALPAPRAGPPASSAPQALAAPPPSRGSPRLLDVYGAPFKFMQRRASDPGAAAAAARHGGRQPTAIARGHPAPIGLRRVAPRRSSLPPPPMRPQPLSSVSPLTRRLTQSFVGSTRRSLARSHSTTAGATAAASSLAAAAAVASYGAGGAGPAHDKAMLLGHEQALSAGSSSASGQFAVQRPRPQQAPAARGLSRPRTAGTAPSAATAPPYDVRGGDGPVGAGASERVLPRAAARSSPSGSHF